MTTLRDRETCTHCEELVDDGTLETKEALQKCQQCGEEVPQWRKFCPNCGTKVEQITLPVPTYTPESEDGGSEDTELGVRCSACDAPLSDDHKFCPKCGTKVEEKRPRPTECPKCGGDLSEDHAFCPKCGKRIGEEEEEESPAGPDFMKCQHCGTKMEKDRLFCTQCGTRMAPEAEMRPAPAQVRCTNCGTMYSDGIRFCPRCGRPKGVSSQSLAPVVAAQPIQLQPMGQQPYAYPRQQPQVPPGQQAYIPPGQQAYIPPGQQIQQPSGQQYYQQPLHQQNVYVQQPPPQKPKKEYKAGRAAVGVFCFIIAGYYLIWMFIAEYIYEMVSFVPFVGEVVGRFFEIIIIILIILAIIWIVLGIGLIANQEWAATIVLVLAIISLIISLLSCDCIGIIIALVIIWLVK